MGTTAQELQGLGLTGRCMGSVQQGKILFGGGHWRTLLANSGADRLLSSSLRRLDGPGRGLDVDVDVVLLDDLLV